MKKCSCVKGVGTLAGDFLIRKGGPVHSAIEEQGFSPLASLGGLLGFIQESDFFFLNFEGAITTSSLPRGRSLPEHFYIKSDPAITEYLKKLNKNVICSFANNHIADFAEEGMRDSYAIARKSACIPVGLGTRSDLDTPTVIEAARVRIAFLAFTDLLPQKYFASDTLGAFELTEENLRTAINAAKKVSDLIVVSLHTVATITTKFSEAPDHAQKRWGALAADLGAHLVVGHQPHGIQSVERRNGAYIFHSLGACIYNPGASSFYPKGHLFHEGTQFFGGSLLKVSFCVHGIAVSKWMPTQSVFIGEQFRITQGSYLSRLNAASLLLLS